MWQQFLGNMIMKWSNTCTIEALFENKSPQQKYYNSLKESSSGQQNALPSNVWFYDDFAIWYPRVMKDQTKSREWEADNRICPLSKQRSLGVNIAFPCLAQLYACSLDHLLQRIKMEERNSPLGWWKYSLPSQRCETWTHTHTAKLSHLHRLQVILICVSVLQWAESHFVWWQHKVLFLIKTSERF